MLPGNSQQICTGDYQFVHCHVYLRCLVYESMYSLYRMSSTMTECDYKKSENARQLSRTTRTALLRLDQWRRLAGFPCHVTETANKLRVAIAFGRTREIMHQSAQRTYGFRVVVYVHWVVFGLLLELRGQNHQNKYDCWPGIICC